MKIFTVIAGAVYNSKYEKLHPAHVLGVYDSLELAKLAIREHDNPYSRKLSDYIIEEKEITD